MAYLQYPTQKQLDFLDKYAERTVSYVSKDNNTRKYNYHLKLGGIGYHFELYIYENDHWINGTKEDLKLLKGIEEEAG